MGNEVSSTSCPYAGAVSRDPDAAAEDEDEDAKAPIGVVYVLAAAAREMGNTNKAPAVDRLLDNLLRGQRLSLYPRRVRLNGGLSWLKHRGRTPFLPAPTPISSGST